MGGVLSICFPSSSGDGNIDERTALLNSSQQNQISDILPEAEVQPQQRTTEQQLQQQRRLREILDLASERFISIESPSPFPSTSLSTNTSTSTSPTTSQTPKDRKSTWRPPTTDGEIKVLHLGTTFDSHYSSNNDAERERPVSAFSLRTLPRNGGGGKSPLRPDGEEEEREEGESRYGTVTSLASYRTAHEGGGSTMGRGGSGSGRRGVRDVFAVDGEEEGELEHEEREAEEGEEEQALLLKKAIQELERSMESFEIKGFGGAGDETGEGLVEELR